jgi:two-component system sensor histidine kinase UhpB
MRISDDGVGFETHDATDRHGIGLLSICERVRMLGGSFDINSSPNEGTVVTVTVPLSSTETKLTA